MASGYCSSELSVRPAPRYCYIKSRMHDFVLEANGNSERSGVSVCQKRKVPVDHQLWFLDDAGDGFVYICSKLDPTGGMVLDIKGASTGKRANIIIYHRKNPERSSRDKNPANQKWKLQPDGTIVSALNGYVLDVKGAKREERTPVITFPMKESGLLTNQLWSLEPAFPTEKSQGCSFQYPASVPQHLTQCVDGYPPPQLPPTYVGGYAPSSACPGYNPEPHGVPPYSSSTAPSAPYPPPHKDVTVNVYNN